MPYSPKPKTILEKEDVEEMIYKAYQIFGSEEEKALTVSSLVALLWLGGCRISEALAVKREDIKIDEKYLFVTISPLKRWQRLKSGTKRVKQYVALALPRKKSIFTKLIIKQTMATDPGEKLWDFVRKTGWKYMVMLNPKIYPHLFRHSRATHLADRGIGDDQLRRWMGWAKGSKMASIYVDFSKIEMAKIGDVLEE